MIKAIDAEQDEGTTPSLSSLPSVQITPQAADPFNDESAAAVEAERFERSEKVSLELPEGCRRGPASSKTDSPSCPTGKAEAESILDPNSDIPFLTLEEKRRILARIARVNPLDCFDESGAFDIVRAKLVLPPGAVRHIAVDETTRLDAEGRPVTQRRINVRLVDPVSALRLDDLLERQREPGASRSHSNSSTNTKTFSRKDFNLLAEKTMALDDANHSIEQLRKALAEMDDRELQLSKELDEKDRQLEAATKADAGGLPGPGFVGRPLRLPEFPNTPDSSPACDAENSNLSSPPLPTPVQGDTGCQPVDSISQTPSSSSSSSSKSLGAVEGQAWNAEKIARKRKPIEVRILEQEIEHRRNTSGIGGFNNWLRSKGLDPAKYPSPPFVPRHPAAKPQKSHGYSACPAAALRSAVVPTVVFKPSP